MVAITPLVSGGYNEYALYFRARRMALNIAKLRQLLKRRRGFETDEAGERPPASPPNDGTGR
jgi:hypothetical protein